MSKSTIYKYQVGMASAGDNVAEVAVPKGAKYLSCKVQDGVICVWYQVNPEEKELIKHTWLQLGTGHPLPFKVGDKNFKFVDTLVVDEYGLVWHMFVREF